MASSPYRTARRHLDRLIVTVSGSGSAATDTTNFGNAVTMCNAEWSNNSRASTIEVDGSITLNANQDLSGPISLIGTSPDAGINFESSGGNLLSWNESWSPTSETHFDCYVAAGEQRVYWTGGATIPSVGDWIVLWSEDQLTGVAPHYTGGGQHPMELHHVDKVDTTNNIIYVNGFVADAMTANARGRGVVVPSTVWSKGIRIENLLLNWSGSTPSDYTTVLKVACAENLKIDNVRTTRTGPGAIWLDFCGNATVNAEINGIAKEDNMYGTVAATVQGVKFDCIVRNTRHAFTTTSSLSVDTSTSIDSVQIDPTNTITKASHGLSDGQSIQFGGTPPSPLTTNTVYWVENAGATTFQVAATPGGAAIALTDTGTSPTIERENRWGTPRGVVWDGIVYANPKLTGSAPTTSASRIAFDTHAEGWGIVCRADFVLADGISGECYAAQSRARHTVFKGCTIQGGTGGGGIGIRMLGEGCRVEDCSISDCWRGIIIDDVDGVSPDNCQVTGTVVRDASSHAVLLADGDNHNIQGNTFLNCADTQFLSPFGSKSVIRASTGTGHKIINNNIVKGSNDYAIDTYQLTTSNLTLANNTLTGYGDAGIGRQMAFTVDTGTDVCTISGSLTHPWANGDTVRLTTSGTLPAGSTTGTDYTIESATTTTFKLTGVNFTDTGSGTHKVEASGRSAINSAAIKTNTTDVSGTSSAGIIADGLLGATPTVDWSDGVHRSGVIDANITTLTFTAPDSAGDVKWLVTLSGAYTVDWSNVSLVGKTPNVPTLSGATYEMTFYYDGTNYSWKG